MCIASIWTGSGLRNAGPDHRAPLISFSVDKFKYSKSVVSLMVSTTARGVRHQSWGGSRLVGWTIFGVRYRWWSTSYEFTSPEAPSGKPDFLLLRILEVCVLWKYKNSESI